MKYFKVLLIPIIGIAAILISCERDDICAEATATTPRLIVDMIDPSTDNSKNVFSIVVIGADFVTNGVISADNDNYLEGYYLENNNQLVLPLKTTTNSTEYIIVEQASVNDNDTPDDTTDDYIDGNQDRIIINFSREQVYVSRACGFKTIYKNVTLTIVEDDDNWMLSRQPLTDNQSVEDETTTHFNISH